ncbi:MAG: sortase [Clostridia bacterium]
MNQILVTEKIYVTPELKRKRKLYKIEFFLSVFLICSLFTYYIYAEYDKTKSEEVSKMILSELEFKKPEENQNDHTTISVKDNDVIVVALQNHEQTDQETVNVDELIAQEQEKNKPVEQEIRTAPSGDTYTVLGVVNIPKIDVNYPIFSKTTDELLKMSPCRFWGADLDKGHDDINKVGNFCIVGHNYRNKRFFSKVPTLENGDIIELTDLKENTVQYEVYDKYTVEPNDKSCTSQWTDGKREVTLITCTNDSSLRVVVKAREIQK